MIELAENDYEYIGSAVIFCFKGRRFGTEFTIYCNETGYLVTNETTKDTREYSTLAELQKEFPEIAVKIAKRMNGEVIS